LFVTWRSTY